MLAKVIIFYCLCDSKKKKKKKCSPISKYLLSYIISECNIFQNTSENLKSMQKCIRVLTIWLEKKGNYSKIFPQNIQDL